MQIKLTEAHKRVLSPLIQAKQKAEYDLQQALILITGKDFISCSINEKEGLLEVEESPLEVNTTE